MFPMFPEPSTCWTLAQRVKVSDLVKAAWICGHRGPSFNPLSEVPLARQAGQPGRAAWLQHAEVAEFGGWFLGVALGFVFLIS